MLKAFLHVLLVKVATFPKQDPTQSFEKFVAVCEVNLVMCLWAETPLSPDQKNVFALVAAVLVAWASRNWTDLLVPMRSGWHVEIGKDPKESLGHSHANFFLPCCCFVEST